MNRLGKKSRPNPGRKKPAILRRLPTNVSLSWKTRQKLDAVAEYKVSQGEQRPDRSWMLERGVELYFGMMAAKHPALQPRLSDIDATYERAVGIPGLDLIRGESDQVTSLHEHPSEPGLQAPPNSDSAGARTSLTPKQADPLDASPRSKKAFG